MGKRESYLMKHNCFSYSYERLKSVYGDRIPNEWRCYSEADFQHFSINASKYLARKIHYSYFESFCDSVSFARENDIILTKDSIGIAINQYKYMTLKLRSGKPCLVDIEKKDKIMRVRDE